MSLLRESESAQALHATIIKKLEYPLLAMTLTREECDDILRPLLRATLPKTRINRNFNRKVLHAPGGLLGLELPCLYTTQVVEHVECLLRHGGSQSITGKLLEAALEVAKAEAGVQGSLFGNSFKTYGHLITSSWIKEVWREIDDNSIQFEERTTSLQPKRDNEVYINEKFVEHGYTPNQRKILNTCRIFLRVTVLSDIISGDGCYMLPFVRNGPNPIQAYSDIKWPTQSKPSEASWVLWRRALRRCFPSNSFGRLEAPLGKWHTTNRKWGSFYENSTQSMYVHTTQWNRFVPNTNQFTGYNERYSFIDHTPPPQNISHVAVAWIDDTGRLITHGIGKWEHHSTPRTDHWTTEWTSHITAEQSTILANAIQNGQAKAVTDGSYQTTGSAGYCLTYNNIKWRGACRVPGNKAIQCAYRSELTGILAVLYMVKQLCLERNLDNGWLTIACDNIAAGKALCQTHYPNPQQNHFDLIQAIFLLRQELPISFFFRHVEGHQASKHPLRDLDEWAILNEEMDGLAKAYFQHSRSLPSLSNVLNGKEWHLHIQGNKICVQMKKTLERFLRSLPVLDAWTKPSISQGMTKPPDSQSNNYK